MDLSIVISLYNEEESIPELLSWIERALSSQKLAYEIILVDDGSTDNSWEVIKRESSQYRIRVMILYPDGKREEKTIN